MEEFYTPPIYYNGELTYVQVPRLIFNPPFEGLNDDARVLYGMLLDRMEESYDDPARWNNDGRAYIYYQQKEVMQKFHVAHGKAISLFQMLEAADLIQYERQRAARKSNRIYINEYWEDPPPEGESPRERFERESRNPFKGPKRRMFSYINVYWALFAPPYEELSNSARILYGLLVKRMNWVQKKNKGQRDEESAYIYYEVEKVMQTLHVAKKKAIKTIRELETANLIRRERRGFGKPSKIRILLPMPTGQTPGHVQKDVFYTYPKSDLDTYPKSDLDTYPKSDLDTSTYMNIYNPNNYSSNNYSINQSTGNKPSRRYVAPTQEAAQPAKVTKEEISAQINRERLYEVYPEYKDYIDRIIELMYDEVTSVYPYAQISQAPRSRAEVRTRLLALTSEDVEGVIDRMTHLSYRPQSPRAYLLTSLYNAATTPTTGRRETKEEAYNKAISKYVRRLTEEIEAQEQEE